MAFERLSRIVSKSVSLENFEINLSRVLERNNENIQLMLETSMKTITDIRKMSVESVIFRGGFAEAMANLVSGLNSMLTVVMKQFSETMEKFSMVVQTKVEKQKG